jgi:hypothetical protein
MRSPFLVDFMAHLSFPPICDTAPVPQWGLEWRMDAWGRLHFNQPKSLIARGGHGTIAIVPRWLARQFRQIRESLWWAENIQIALVHGWLAREFRQIRDSLRWAGNIQIALVPGWLAREFRQIRESLWWVGNIQIRTIYNRVSTGPRANWVHGAVPDPTRSDMR